MPWAKEKLRQRKEGRGGQGQIQSQGQSQMDEGDVGVSNDISLHRMPSSTSVFRTPSSVVAGVGLERGGGRD